MACYYLNIHFQGQRVKVTTVKIQPDFLPLFCVLLNSLFSALVTGRLRCPSVCPALYIPYHYELLSFFLIS